MTRAGTDTAQTVPRIADNVTAPDQEDGWQYSPGSDTVSAKVTFYGTWKPEPGDELNVFQAAGASNPQCVTGDAGVADDG